MFSKIKYPALNAKMKGMYTKELSQEELDELLRLSSLKDVIYFLKTKFSSLENINENMNRREIEQELNNLFIEDILKISKYLNKKENEIFMDFLSKYEINIVKNVFRNVTTNRDSKRYLRNVDNWTSKMFISLQKINDITSEKEFFEIIKNQEYFYIFEEYLKEQKDIPLEELEIMLDKFYFEKIYNEAKSYNKELENMIGTEIDLLNIITIYRANKYFAYSDNEIKKLLIPIFYKLNKNTVNKLINCNDFDEVASSLNKTPYSEVFKEENYLEHDKNQYLYNIYIKYFREKLFNICTVFCNINLIDVEIKNIINIIEGIRYNIDKTEIQKKIVF